MNLVEIMAGGFMLGDAREFAVASNRYPCVKVAGEYKPLGKQAASDDDIMDMVLELGGRAHAQAIGAQPTTWRFADVALGPLQVTVARRSGALQIRVVASAVTGSTAGAAPPPVPAVVKEPVRAPQPLSGSAAAEDEDEDDIPAVLRGAPAALELDTRVMPRGAPATLELDTRAVLRGAPATLELDTPVATPPAKRASVRPVPAAPASVARATNAASSDSFGVWLAQARERGATDAHRRRSATVRRDLGARRGGRGADAPHSRQVAGWISA
jgi:hypothetical protein